MWEPRACLQNCKFSWGCCLPKPSAIFAGSDRLARINLSFNRWSSCFGKILHKADTSTRKARAAFQHSKSWNVFSLFILGFCRLRLRSALQLAGWKQPTRSPQLAIHYKAATGSAGRSLFANQKTTNGDIFVDLVPVDTDARTNQPPVGTLLVRRIA